LRAVSVCDKQIANKNGILLKNHNSAVREKTLDGGEDGAGGKRKALRGGPSRAVSQFLWGVFSVVQGGFFLKEKATWRLGSALQ
jgi:hypothetical protein